ncbi:hypothetical protein [Streptomyces sp. NPDC101393]|uniref:hypothetical protein n=1 Tax=Streptomyces sp. NPDC101393 TaxID=3366141 RepID=UPI0037FD2705
MADDAIALDGFLDEETVPGDVHGSTARFRLTVSPTDERADEMILPCSVADPSLAHAVIHDLVPGDKLRVTGYLRLPRTPDEPVWLVVTTLAVLETAPLLSDPPRPTRSRAPRPNSTSCPCPNPTRRRSPWRASA